MQRHRETTRQQFPPARGIPTPEGSPQKGQNADETRYRHMMKHGAVHHGDRKMHAGIWRKAMGGALSVPP